MLAYTFRYPNIYTDRVKLSELPVGIAKELREKRLITTGEIEKTSFVGVLMKNNDVCVFLPRSTVLVDQDENLTHASNTLKAVEKYGRVSNTSLDAEEGEGQENLNQLSLICVLLEDFRKNGIYTRRRSVKKRNQGRVDWKRTVNKIIPFYNRNMEPIYLDTYGVKRQYFNNCEIAAIHAKIIHQLDNQFSWIVTGNSQPIAPELRDYAPPNGNNEYQISKLKNELNQVYSDRDMRLLKQLIRYLEKDSGSDSSCFIAGLGKFHFCWEYMLGDVLGYKAKLNHKLPVPVYINIAGKELNQSGRGMRTDIILLNENINKCVVADAKYYAATNSSDAPGWSDIVKQLFYEKALRTLNIKATIRNVFIFPGESGNLREVRIKNRVNSTKANPVYIEEFNPVYCYYVEPMKVIEHFISREIMNNLSDQLLEGKH